MRYSFKQFWSRIWMRYADLGPFGGAATYLASLAAPPHKGARYLAMITSRGYIAPSAKIRHSNINLGENIFLGDRVLVYEEQKGGIIRFSKKVTILRDTILETGNGGGIIIGDETWIHPQCHLSSYLNAIEIGKRVLIAANTAFYSHNHGIKPGEPIISQPSVSKGPIVIDDDVWIGTGVIVLNNVNIGKGAVIGAGSVVTRNIPSNAIAFGVPAKVAGFRDDFQKTKQ